MNKLFFKKVLKKTIEILFFALGVLLGKFLICSPFAWNKLTWPRFIVDVFVLRIAALAIRFLLKKVKRLI